MNDDIESIREAFDPDLHLRLPNEALDRLVAERDQYAESAADLGKGIEGAWNEIEKLRAERDATREQVEEILTRWYATDQVAVARLCDDELDRSGALLGRIRNRYRHPSLVKTDP